VLSAFEDMLCSRDRELLDDQRYASAFADTVREGLRAGTSGGGWDNVSWIGEWDIDLSAVRCPVLLWYGSDDRFAQPVHRVWLSEHLLRARLVVHDGEGHLGIFEHLGENARRADRARHAGPGQHRASLAPQCPPPHL
jgi:pimeloyl-ACP methyl ester carboxylesterase